MAALKNKFSWSFSASHAFEDCRRQRYWDKHGKWGGWNKSAPEDARKAYQLSKMDNIYSLQGRAAEDAIMWALRELQAGRSIDVEQVYASAAKDFLNSSWKQSVNEEWRQNAKRNCCLREHYYKTWQTKEIGIEAAKRAAEHTRRCIQNFINTVWPRLKDVDPKDEILIAGPGGGDPENFEFEGIKIYAIPDYAYLTDGIMYIHDWKAGKIKDSHLEQLAIYGLWAREKYGIAPEKVVTRVEYIGLGKMIEATLDQEAIDNVIDSIGGSVAEMTEYLVNCDRDRNEALPKSEWELAQDPAFTCQYCNFYELCEKELKSPDADL